MTVKEKIISFDPFIQENSESFISKFKAEIRILFEEDDNFVVNGILFVLTRSSRRTTENNWSF